MGISVGPHRGLASTLAKTDLDPRQLWCHNDSIIAPFWWRMASLTIKNIPEDLLERLRAKAASDRRSLTKEVVHLLETVLAGESADAEGRLRAESESQVAAWRRLAGRWKSDRTLAEETPDIYEKRTSGREVDL